MKIFLSSLQWAAFILVGSIVAPIVIGVEFGLSTIEIAAFLQRTLFVLGCAALLQVLFGHHLPVAEGPAGLWWGIFIVYAGLASSGALTEVAALRQLEATMLISGILFILIGLFRGVDKIKRLFTPLVTGTFLILLVAQLGGSFVKGVIGVGYLTDSVEPKIAIPAIIILVTTILLSRSRYSFIRSYSILMSLGIGWLLFYLLGLTKPLEKHSGVLALPKIFAFGIPDFTAGTVITAAITTMLLLTNLIASVSVIENVIRNQTGATSIQNFNRSSFWAGINQGLSGLFGAVGPVPLSATAGFLLTTRTVEKLPFILANALIIIISFFPAFTSIAANIPSPVGYAVIFITIASLASLGIKEYHSLELTERELFIISLSLMVGIGCLFIPSAAITHLPNVVMLLANNGLILGTVVCILLEQLFKIKERIQNEKE
ncbi:xanthine permease [Pueribacillus theae]|uniref:Xanthine permease n=1 Tax=Pueribacillus theae TaxID=2171751 RepID=A0A2U1JJJ2_9BACI|nr:purine/pyrimidine permease [Pueribacillus theae]PWA05307.1 xanthine permease [Pueribacillus theae]